MNPVPKFLQFVAATKGMSIESVVLTVACRAPRLADAVLDYVGSYPSAEPAICALQRLWTPR
jgi:hypothetical protein